MNCPSCQAALPDDAVFCGRCVSPLQAMHTCTGCVARLASGSVDDAMALERQPGGVFRQSMTVWESTPASMWYFT